MCSSLTRYCCSNAHTHCSIRDTQPVVRGARLGQFTLSLDLVFSAAISRVSFAFQSPRADRRFGPIAGFSLFCANGVGKTGGNHSLHAPTRANIPTSPYGSRRFKREWNTRNRQNGSGHELSIGHSPSSARKKAVRKKAESPRPLRKEAGSKSKSRKLGCRYCGSNDLAPSFIKRRDRRCRKCFSKRYGSAARARKAKVKK